MNLSALSSGQTIYWRYCLYDCKHLWHFWYFLLLSYTFTQIMTHLWYTERVGSFFPLLMMLCYQFTPASSLYAKLKPKYILNLKRWNWYALCPLTGNEKQEDLIMLENSFNCGKLHGSSKEGWQRMDSGDKKGFHDSFLSVPTRVSIGRWEEVGQLIICCSPCPPNPDCQSSTTGTRATKR